MLKYLMFVAVLSLVPVAVIADDAAPAPITVPGDVHDAKKTVHEWMKELLNKSQDQVIAILGKDYEKDTWDFKGTAEPELKYKIDDDAHLSILFLDGKVVTVSFQIIAS